MGYLALFYTNNSYPIWVATGVVEVEQGSRDSAVCRRGFCSALFPSSLWPLYDTHHNGAFP